MNRILQRFPLIWVVALFGLLIAAWSTLITIAVKNAPEQIVIEKSAQKSG